MIKREKYCSVLVKVLLFSALLWGGMAFASSSQETVPLLWGEDIPGVMTHFNTREPVLALTLDACGGKRGSGFDKKLITWLKKHNIPATLFLTGRWIDANKKPAQELASCSLFEIENHGMNHRPCSVSGRLAYGIPGTKNVSEVINEVQDGADTIKEIIDRKTRFFRSGTNYYDEIAIATIEKLGYNAVGYSIAGDEGATLSKEAIIIKLLKAKPGDIILCHMNHPESDTAEGLIEVIPILQERGFRFVTLKEYPLQ